MITSKNTKEKHEKAPQECGNNNKKIDCQSSLEKGAIYSMNLSELILAALFFLLLFFTLPYIKSPSYFLLTLFLLNLFAIYAELYFMLLPVFLFDLFIIVLLISCFSDIFGSNSKYTNLTIFQRINHIYRLANKDFDIYKNKLLYNLVLTRFLLPSGTIPTLKALKEIKYQYSQEHNLIFDNSPVRHYVHTYTYNEIFFQAQTELIKTQRKSPREIIYILFSSAIGSYYEKVTKPTGFLLNESDVFFKWVIAKSLEENLITIEEANNALEWIEEETSYLKKIAKENISIL